MKLGVRKQGHASLKVNVAKALPQHMRADIRELTQVRTEPEYRGRGEARDLMLAVCLDADVDEKFLLVHVEPADDSPMDKEALANFYVSLGFQPIQSEPLLMVRPHIRAAIAGSSNVNVAMTVDKENNSGRPD